MKRGLFLSLAAISFVVSAAGISYTSQTQKDFSPKPEEQQLPGAMHSAMKELPCITVGKENTEIIGHQDRDRAGSAI